MPSVSWLTARAEIASILTNLAITAPIAATIQSVFETPPAKVADDYCIVIMGTAKAVERSNGLRIRTYAAKIRLMVFDADLPRSADIIDGFTEAITSAFDDNLTLNGKVNNLQGPTWNEPGVVMVGAIEYSGCDGVVTFYLNDAPGFNP